MTIIHSVPTSPHELGACLPLVGIPTELREGQYRKNEKHDLQRWPRVRAPKLATCGRR